MKQNPTISIVTPCFNTGALLFETADSLASQTCKDFEWIIVDDGSSAETKKILSEIAFRSDIHTSVVFATHKGGNFCRNLGFSQSAGKLVKFFDADDLLEPKLIENQLNTALENPNSLIVSPTAFKNEDKLILPKMIKSSVTTDPLKSYLIRPYFMHGGALIPRDFVENINGWDESLNFGQDLDFFRRLLLQQNLSVVIDNRSSFIYRQHSLAPRLSRPNKNVCALYEGQLLALDKFAKALESSEREEELRPFLASNLDHWAASAAVRCPKMCQTLLDRAKAMSPNYPITGNNVYRTLRKLVGIRVASRLNRSRIFKSIHSKLFRRNIPID